MSDDEDLDLAAAIAREIRLWSHHCLEVPSPSYDGIPACPFARAAWMNEAVVLTISPDINSAIELKAMTEPDEDTVHILAWTDWDEMSPEEMDAWIEEQNLNHFGVWMMGFHPEAATNEGVSPFEGIVEDDYGVILVQSLGRLVEASEKLRRTGYYDGFSPDDLEYINRRKETFDAWNEEVAKKMHHPDRWWEAPIN